MILKGGRDKKDMLKWPLVGNEMSERQWRMRDRDPNRGYWCTVLVLYSGVHESDKHFVALSCTK